MARGYAAGDGIDLLPSTVMDVNSRRKVSNWGGVATFILGGRFVVWGVFEVGGEARARGGMGGGGCGG